MTKEKKSHSVTPFYRALWFYVVLFWVLISIVCFFPSWFTSKTILDRDFSNTGEIGDTIGGIMTPFIAIIGAFVTFIAFWVQYEANRSQRKDIQIERFENNFYEMLKIHRDNVAEMKMSTNYLNKKYFQNFFLS
ncbi:MAG: hypothetical protein IPO47_04870 [Bacteroidetes bacterium]|nr:hypothetical protein [Bacteroidota bacterium]